MGNDYAHFSKHIHGIKRNKALIHAITSMNFLQMPCERSQIKKTHPQEKRVSTAWFHLSMHTPLQ